jgi:hypothetical protein
MPGPANEQVQSHLLNTLDSLPSTSTLNSQDLVVVLEDGSEFKFLEGESLVQLKGVLDSLVSREVS